MTHEEILEQLGQTVDREGREVLTGEIEGFEIRVEMAYDDGMIDWYGDFCEKERPPKWTNSKTFFVRNENAWRKRDLGEGTDSWVRIDSRTYGWFAWAQFDPEEEAAAWMKNGLSEREAWDRVLGIIRKTVEGLASGDLHAIILTATAYREGIELGSASLGGIEQDSRESASYNRDSRIDHATDLVAEAIHDAKKALAKLCECH